MLDFLRKPAFALDISDYSIEALLLEKEGGKIYLGAYGRVELEKGIVKDGQILDREKLKKKIKELIHQAKPRPLEGSEVIFSLPESKTYFAVFKFPAKLKKEELSGAIEKEALKTIPLKADKIYSDFVIVSETKETKSLLYVSALREIVDSYLEVLREAGLKPLALDIESASLTRAFEREMVKDGGVLIVDIGARTTNLTVFDKDSIRFSAIIPLAGNDFSQALSEKLNSPFKKAEKLKRQYGLDPKAKEDQVMLVLQNILQEVLEEIKRSVSFYEEKSKRKIKKILLCGGSSLMPKLASYFSSNLDIETKVADPLKDMPLKRKIKESVLFSNVIGLAKRALEENPEEAGINLIPRDKRGKKAVGKKPLFILLIVLIVALVGFLVYNFVLKKEAVETPPREELTEEEVLPEEIAEEATTTEEVEEEEPAAEEEPLPQVTVLETPTGWLRVRQGPGLNYSEVARVYPGEVYTLLEESSGWYKIEIEEGLEGWIYALYATEE